MSRAVDHAVSIAVDKMGLRDIGERIDRNAFMAKRELRRLAITMKDNITRSYHRKLREQGAGS